MDWAELFVFTVHPFELIVRGTAMYWFLFVVFRTLFRRDIGAVTVADMLVLMLIADASQNAMAGEYKSISDGCVLVLSIVSWNLLIDWLNYRFPAIRTLLEPRPLPLIVNGRLLHRNMRKEFITLEELKAKLREHGIEDLAEVKSACMESDGEISVIEFDTQDKPTDNSGKPEVVP
ncbi:DUF421 domain-containing protein [Chitinimonas lacunae]|uniref:DUF421 domain-containing protein n=1 Tax=Chitinimonas lacunae TaxID=1963018 RepID=A0ABV8MN44_9NEIS